MWDFSDAHELLNQSISEAREMVREIFTRELGDIPDPPPPRHDADDAEPPKRIQLDGSLILNDSDGKEISFIEPVKSTDHASWSKSCLVEPAKKNSILKDTWEEDNITCDTLTSDQ
jgi:hypothetical protein